MEVIERGDLRVLRVVHADQSESLIVGSAAELPMLRFDVAEPPRTLRTAPLRKRPGSWRSETLLVLAGGGCSVCIAVGIWFMGRLGGWW